MYLYADFNLVNWSNCARPHKRRSHAVLFNHVQFSVSLLAGRAAPRRASSSGRTIPYTEIHARVRGGLFHIFGLLLFHVTSDVIIIRRRGRFHKRGGGGKYFVQILIDKLNDYVDHIVSRRGFRYPAEGDLSPLP